MTGQDKSLEKQKIRAEDVAYAAFHDTLFDIEEEMTKYDNAVFSDDKLQTALVELDELQNSIDTSYNILLDAAISPLSSRLRRRKANLETRIAEMKNLLTSNAAHSTTEQRELCGTSDESQVIVAASECDDDDSLLIDDTDMQSSNTRVLLLTFIILLTVIIDSTQYGPENLDPIDGFTVAPDKDGQMEKDPVSGSTTDDVLYRDLDMTTMKSADYCDAETDDLACDCRSINGLKHRWRWKQYELL